MKRRIIVFVLFAASCIGMLQTLQAQHELTTYPMANVPQRNYLNPAFIPERHAWIGFPAISGIHGAQAIPFSYNDVLTRGSDDSLTFEVTKFLDQIGKNDRILLTSNIDLLSFGTSFAGNRFYIGFSLRERISQQMNLPADLFNLVWYGNHAPQTFGKQVNIAPRVDAVAFDEYGINLAGKMLTNKLTWGFKIKYLSGRFNARTVKSDFQFYTDPESYKIHMQSDLEVQTSGIDDVEHYFDQSIEKLIFSGNHGFGVDLGVDYRINERFSVNASVLDIGYIRWKKDNLAWVSHEPGKDFIFSGLNINDFVDLFEDPGKFGDRVEDSLRALLHIDSVYDQPYTAWLPMKIYLGGSYSLNEHHRFNLLLNSISWNSRFSPALSLSYNYRPVPFLELTASYSAFNNQYFNIGGGVAVNAGPVFFYVISDNIPGLISYKDFRNYSFQFGIGFLLGKKETAVTATTTTAAEPE